VAVAGGRKFNPGFHLAFDLDNMLLVAESTAKSALLREESRGGHTRDDFPGMNNTWRQVNHISSFDGNQVSIKAQALPMLPKELFDLFDVHELEKYMTPEEIAKGGSN
jgi:succinate dehydrogenase / fumarate reductase flavoprotein subunit